MIIKQLIQEVRLHYPESVLLRLGWAKRKSNSWEIYIWAHAKTIGIGSSPKAAWQDAWNKIVLEKLEQ